MRLIRTLSTTLLQRFCEILLNSKIIVKSILDPGQMTIPEGTLLSIAGLMQQVASTVELPLTFQLTPLVVRLEGAEDAGGPLIGIYLLLAALLA